MSDDQGECLEAETSFLADACEEYDAEIMLINSPMSGGISEKVRSLLERKPRARPNILLFLVTPGGLADEAYRVGRMLQERYERIIICIAGWCKSAGTLLAISAHELLIGARGELGPLDVQITKRDELFDRDSGLMLNAALDRLRDESFQTFEETMLKIISKSQNAITFRTAADVAAEITVGLMGPVFDKIDPLRLGTDARAMEIGSAYALRLNMDGKNLQSAETLNMLLNGYPSHSFVIDYREASVLFTNVKPLEGNIALVAQALGDHAVIPSDEASVCFLDEHGGGDDEESSIQGEAKQPGSEDGSDASNDVGGIDGVTEDL